MRVGKFFVISAASGTGKTTLTRRLLQEVPNLVLSVSYTTRPKRPGEVDGVDYHFVSESGFKKMVQARAFFEWEEVHGAHYGTPKAPLLENQRRGLDTIFDIDTRGALNVKKHFPDSCLIFLLPPSFDVLVERLTKRHTEDPATLKRRIEEGKRQIAEQDKFDYTIINDDFDRAFTELKGIILSKRNKK